MVHDPCLYILINLRRACASAALQATAPATTCRAIRPPPRFNWRSRLKCCSSATCAIPRLFCRNSSCCASRLDMPCYPLVQFSLLSLPLIGSRSLLALSFSECPTHRVGTTLPSYDAFEIAHRGMPASATDLVDLLEPHRKLLPQSLHRLFLHSLLAARHYDKFFIFASQLAQQLDGCARQSRCIFSRWRRLSFLRAPL